MIFVSTGGERRQTAVDAALQYFAHGVNCVELSGGAYSSTCEVDLRALPGEMCLQVHNYFPPPSTPFVFNLASTDSEVATRSLAHVRNAIRIAVMLRRPIYSFHAGFRINPAVRELGNRLSKHSLLARDTALNVFGDRLIALAEEAGREGVTLLVENNVINALNHQIYGEDPLLLTHPDEIATFMERAPSNVGLLMDVAHLKVSANTLDFDMVAAHEKVRRWIKGYHLSDNDGTADTNHPVSDTSWFWGQLVRGLNYYTIEVYRHPISGLVEQRALTEKKLAEVSRSGKSYE
jgi:sugar phosphate isomerase/epimerase